MTPPDPASDASLDGAFPRPDLAAWRDEAARALKGRPLASLTWRVEPGIELEPVQAERPDAVAAPFRTGPLRTCATVTDEDELAGALALGHDLVRVVYDGDDDDAPADLPQERVLYDPQSASGAALALSAFQACAGVVAGWDGLDGATPSQCVGFLASLAVDVLERAPEGAAERLVVEVFVGTGILTEIAKLRALRRLWAEVAAERELPGTLRLLARCPGWPATRVDPESNLLRAALAGCAAIVGGADIVELVPYRVDDAAREASRLALNQVRLMRDESHLDAVADPCAGSGTIETLTDAFVRAGRAEFERLRGLGGMAAACESGDDARLARIVEPYDAAYAARRGDVATRRRTVVGVNRFADPSRDAAALADSVDEELFAVWAEPGASFDDEPHDGVDEFEYLRARALWHAAAGRAAPRVLLLPLGAPARRRARADFAADLFRAGGFAVEDPGAFDSVDAACAHARQSGAPVVVVCGDDADYAALVPQVVAALPGTAVIVAGRPPDGSDAWGAAAFAFEGADALTVLAGALDRAGVGRRP